MGNITLHRQPADDQTLEEMRLIRAELAALRELFVEFGKVYLAARFPYGRPTDRWAPR
jgi:hypothetical protein